MAELQRGIVKWFNDAKGFGFIEHTDGKDVFIHYSVIQSEGYKTLKDGEEVEYELGDGDKGLHAVKVLRVNVKEKKQADETVAPNLENGSVSSVAKPLTHSLEVEASNQGGSVREKSSEQHSIDTIQAENE